MWPLRGVASSGCSLGISVIASIFSGLLGCSSSGAIVLRVLSKNPSATQLEQPPLHNTFRGQGLMHHMGCISLKCALQAGRRSIPWTDFFTCLQPGTGHVHSQGHSLGSATF